MTTVLITGVAGFIGANLAEALLARGYRVHGLDNLSQGSLRNMAEFRDHPAFAFTEGDVRDARLVDDLVERADCVMHLAAFKIPRYGNAMDTLLINTHGTRNVLDAAAKRRRRVVFASTSDVYGRNPEIPFHETSDLWMGPSGVKRWSYAVSKMYDELLCFAYQEEYNLPVAIVRFFGGYGPRQNTTWWGGPQAVFIDAALRGDTMEIHGDGKQTRSFTHVSDHVDGLIRCIEQDAALGQVFNLGNTYEITIFDLAMLVWRLAGSGEPKYRLISYRTFGKYEDVRRRVPDVTKARRLLGFEPRVSLEDGLVETIAWQRRVTDQVITTR
jgi:UDP-glucose 4-epimerase